MSKPRFVEVDFNSMLNSDCPMVCKHWLLSNSINKYGVDFKQPMMFNEFLQMIGTFMTSLNCKSLFQQAEWYIYTCDSDEIVDKYFRKKSGGGL